MAIRGDTVRLQVHFKTFEGASVSPEAITLTIYNYTQEVVETIEEPQIFADQNNIGEYFYDYTIPSDLQDYFIFEFAGTYNKKAILSRQKIRLKFNN